LLRSLSFYDFSNQPSKGTTMIKKILFCLAALAAVSLTACNTVEGAGKDVSATGNAIHDAAKDTKQKM
jgi:predicted small secreted protein